MPPLGVLMVELIIENFETELRWLDWLEQRLGLAPSLQGDGQR